MKKLFALLTATVLASVCFIGGTKQYAPTFAESETQQTSEPIETSSEPQETSENEEEPIDIDHETELVVSSVAHDVIAVIDAVFSQPIVIGGISTTLGVVFLWAFGKMLEKLLSKRNSKYDRKIETLLKKIGVTEETIEELKKTVKTLEDLVKVLIESQKNIQVKQQLLNIYNDNSKTIEEKAQEIVETTKESVSNSTQNAIEELLKK